MNENDWLADKISAHSVLREWYDNLVLNNWATPVHEWELVFASGSEVLWKKIKKIKDYITTELQRRAPPPLNSR